MKRIMIVLNKQIINELCTLQVSEETLYKVLGDENSC